MEIFTSYGSVLKNSFQQINADTKRCVRFDLKFLKFKIKGLILTSSGTLFISHFADDASQNIISLRKGSTVVEHNKNSSLATKVGTYVFQNSRNSRYFSSSKLFRQLIRILIIVYDGEGEHINILSKNKIHFLPSLLHCVFKYENELQIILAPKIWIVHDMLHMRRRYSALSFLVSRDDALTAQRDWSEEK